MKLPSQSEVNAAARHIGTFAAGIILAFGLSTKISPDAVQQIIAATGTVVNDGILLIGLVTPIVTSYFASRSATPQAQADAIVAAVPGTTIVTTKELAASTVSDKVVSNSDAKVVTK